MNFFDKTVKPDDHKPLLLLTAHTDSASFHIGGTTIHSVLSLHSDSYDNRGWQRGATMKLKLAKMMMSNR